MKKVIIIINPTSGGETALDYKESLESKVKEYFDYVETKITQKAKDATHLPKMPLNKNMMQWLFLVETVL